MITARNKEVIFHTEYDYLIMRYYDERLNKFIWEYKEEKREKLNRKHIKTYFLIGLPLFLASLKIVSNLSVFLISSLITLKYDLF